MEAERVVRALLDCAPFFEYRLPELFAGGERRRDEAPGVVPTSARPQAWAAGTPLLLLRAQLGLEPDPDARALRVTADDLPALARGLHARAHPRLRAALARARRERHRLRRAAALAEVGTASTQSLPGFRKLSHHVCAVRASPLGKSAGDEGGRGRRVDDGRHSQAFLCNCRVLVLAEEILSVLASFRNRLVRLPGGAESCRVARSFERDPQRVKSRVVGVVAELPDVISKPGELLASNLRAAGPLRRLDAVWAAPVDGRARHGMRGRSASRAGFASPAGAFELQPVD